MYKDPFVLASKMVLHDNIEKALSALTDREATVLRLRFGLEDGISATLEEVGKEFNRHKETIRRIEARALRKLRHPFNAKKFKYYSWLE